MSGWQVAGNAAMAGLGFAPALGHLGGKAMQKLDGPINLAGGGCFVAGTKVHVAALPVSAEEPPGSRLHSAADRIGPAGSSNRHSKPAELGLRRQPAGAGRAELVADRPDDPPRRRRGGRCRAPAPRPVDSRQRLQVGGTLPIHIEELDVHGTAEVRALHACPALALALHEVGETRARQRDAHRKGTEEIFAGVRPAAERRQQLAHGANHGFESRTSGT